MAIQTLKVTKTLPYDDTKIDIKAVAEHMGYQTKIIDETQLDADGNVPMVQATDDAGNLMWETEATDPNADILDPATTFQDKLDADGNKIPLMVAKDVFIDNTQKYEDFIAEKVSENWAQEAGEKIANAAFAVAERDLRELKSGMIKAVVDNTQTDVTKVV